MSVKVRNHIRARKYDFSSVRFGKPMILPYQSEDHGTRQQFSNRIRQAIERAQTAGLVKGLTQRFVGDELHILKFR